MTTVPVRISGELIINLADLPEMALDLIKSSLTLENEDKKKASDLQQMNWWEMPDTIALWRTEKRRSGDEVLLLPRGYMLALISGLSSIGIQIEWDDQRTFAPAAEGYFRQFLLRDYQFDATVDILKYAQGVYKAPAGSGKTVTSLGAMSYMNQRTLVVVDKAYLVEQWRARAAEFFDFPFDLDEDGQRIGATLTKGAIDAREAGKIGQDVWEERDLTICLRQTLHSRAWELKATGWWQRIGAVWFDECHHAAADTLADICRCVTSYYMPGVSATPAKSPVKGAIVHALIGPIIHETPRQALYDRKVLMKPDVELLHGDFHADFWPDHQSDGEGNCEMPGCRKKGKHRHRNNYSSVLKKLVEDDARNKRVAARIMQERGHHHLVPSKQLKHLNLIRRELLEAGWPQEKIWLLRGEENARGEAPEIVAAIMAADEAVVLSTVADEALDIAPLDRIHIVYPMRDEGSTIQLVGRGERVFDGKTDSIAIDYREPLVDVLESQCDARCTTYRMQGYDINISPYSVQLEVPQEATA